MKPRFGLALDFWSAATPFARRLDEYVELLALAESLGFDSVWAGENRPRAPEAGHVPSPFLVLAALARETKLRLGTGVALVTIQHPLQLAYDAAMLDQISEGRFILGAGLGSAPLMQRYGIDPASSGRRMDELLACLRGLWRGEDGFEGELIKLRGRVVPGPFTAGGPPILVGGTRRRSAERAAELGAGWYGATQYRLGLITRQAAAYRARLAALGRDPAEGIVAVNRTAFVAESDAVARAEGTHYVNELMNFYASFGGITDSKGEKVPVGADFVEAVDDNVLFVGGPDSVAASIGKYVDAGANLFNLRIAMGDMPIELAKRTVRLLGEKVLPRFA